MTVADRIAVMDQGRIMQVATPAEVYEQPNSRYVADFIGDINLLEGRITGNANGVVKLDCAETGEAHRDRSDGRGPVPAQPPGSRSVPRRSQSQLDPPADQSTNCTAGRGVGHRLSRRRVDLPRASAERCHRPVDRHQPHAPGRAADHLGGQGVAHLVPRRGRHADAVAIMAAPAPRSKRLARAVAARRSCREGLAHGRR